MTILEMLQQSTILTILGMLVVFAFLWLMIICVNLVAKLIHSMGLDKDVLPKTAGTPAAGRGAASPAVASAITAAVIEYRKGDPVQGGQ
ncbi:MAG: OadG family protein [Treponema sp.]|jgi:oxaloacetate decarboxylase gamma subunit|nr:OadG family protein [Treponema sp.]